MAITERDIERIRGHSLRDQEVRQALAGFLSAGLREEHRLQISPKFLNRLIDQYVAAINIAGSVELAQMVQFLEGR
jgi:hypothetical protein